MYEAFFGFQEKPFNTTPDPRFLYLSKKHKEALAQLIYGIKERKGFVVLSGEVGTGKTTVVRALLEQLDPDSQVAYVFSTKLSVKEFLRFVCQDFGLQVYGDSKIDYMTRLLDFLIKSHNEGKSATLIIDEAQNLDFSLFEEIRMLTNFETSSQKLLQVFLVGQPQLSAHLERDELWQLKQRITARYHLLPLDRQETREYIKTRMKIAGATHLDWFTEGAIKKIYRYSGGVPRLINNICDNAFLVAYASDTPVVNEKIVEECVADLKLKRAPRSLKTQGKAGGKEDKRYSYIYAGLIIILIGLLAQGIVFFHFLDRGRSSVQGNRTTGAKEVTETLPQQETDVPREFSAEPGPTGHPQAEPAKELGKPEISQVLSDSESRRIAIAIAGEGESISEIVFKEFGRVDEQLLRAVRELNPEIEDLNRIEVGQKIRLPHNTKGPYEQSRGMDYLSADPDFEQKRARR